MTVGLKHHISLRPGTIKTVFLPFGCLAIFPARIIVHWRKTSEYEKLPSVADVIFPLGFFVAIERCRKEGTERN
jgi:hypothetical protein